MLHSRGSAGAITAQQFTLPILDHRKSIDLVCPLENAGEADVAENALEAVLMQRPVVGQQVHGHGADMLRTVSHLEFADRGEQLPRLPSMARLLPDEAA